MITPCDIIERARAYVGVPYRHQGRNRAGLDCIGLPWLICRDLGLDVPDFAGYGPEPVGGALLREIRDRAPRAAGLQPGTLALMRWFEEPQHAGIVTDVGTLIHAHSRVGRVVEHTIDRKWLLRMLLAVGFPGVTYEPGVLTDWNTPGQPLVVPIAQCLPCREAARA